MFLNYIFFFIFWYSADEEKIESSDTHSSCCRLFSEKKMFYFNFFHMEMNERKCWKLIMCIYVRLPNSSSWQRKWKERIKNHWNNIHFFFIIVLVFVAEILSEVYWFFILFKKEINFLFVSIERWVENFSILLLDFIM